jgi:hypothetical protein
MKRIVCALIICLWACRVDAAVVFDAGFGETHSSGATTIDTQNGSVGAGANRIVIGFILLHTTDITGTTMVYDPAGANQSMTFIGSMTYATATYSIQVFALLNPTTGASKIIRAANWHGGSVAASIGGASFTGADQGSVTATVVAATPTTGTSNAPAITIATANGNATVAAVGDNQTQTLSAPTPQTQIWLANVNIDNGGGYIQSTTASDTHNWTYGGTPPWGMEGVVVYAVGQVPGGTTCVPTLSTLGVSSCGDEVAAPFPSFPGRPHD